MEFKYKHKELIITQNTIKKYENNRSRFINSKHGKYDNRFLEKKAIDGYDYISVTPFPFKERYSNISSESIVNADYCLINIRELKNLRLTGSEYSYLFHLLTHLDFDANIVIVKDFSYISTATVYEYIIDFVNKNILVPMNRQGYYVINHNLFFKGDLTKFKDKYFKLYGDAKPIYDERNRIRAKE